MSQGQRNSERDLVEKALRFLVRRSKEGGGRKGGDPVEVGDGFTYQCGARRRGLNIRRVAGTVGGRGHG